MIKGLIVKCVEFGTFKAKGILDHIANGHKDYFYTLTPRWVKNVINFFYLFRNIFILSFKAIRRHLYKKCTMCPYMCPRITTLRNHIEKIHQNISNIQVRKERNTSPERVRFEGTTVFKCDLCEKVFDTSIQVTAHKIIGHFYDKPYHPLINKISPEMVNIFSSFFFSYLT
jgi:uncharacterized Fe-S cluster-containing MiaB family protein